MSRALTRRRRRNPFGRLNRRAKWALGLAALGIGAYFLPDAYDRITYGPAVGKNAPRDGYLPIEPAVLAGTAGWPVETYSLARVIRSEAGGRDDAEKVAVAWVTKNVAAKRGLSVTDLVTARPYGKTGAGFYGAQNLGSRFVASGQAPREADLKLADDIQRGYRPDNTDGALHFFAPSLQDRLVSIGRKGYTTGSAAIIAAWSKEGLVPHPLSGGDPKKFLLFSPPGGGGLYS